MAVGAEGQGVQEAQQTGVPGAHAAESEGVQSSGGAGAEVLVEGESEWDEKATAPCRSLVYEVPEKRSLPVQSLKNQSRRWGFLSRWVPEGWYGGSKVA